MKTTVITGLNGSESNKKILYLSYCYVGKTHDYRMLKEELPPSQDWFKNFKVRLDLGYIGFDKDYECKQVYLPAKNYKKSPLTENQKLLNRDMPSQRIDIEHSIGLIKRYGILSGRLRMHDFEKYDDVLEVCAGLTNFYLSN